MTNHAYLVGKIAKSGSVTLTFGQQEHGYSCAKQITLNDRSNAQSILDWAKDVMVRGKDFPIAIDFESNMTTEDTKAVLTEAIKELNK